MEVEKVNEVDVVGTINALKNLANAGTVGWILLIIIGGMGIGFLFWWKKEKKRIAKKKTDEGRERDQASTVSENTAIENDFDQAEADIDDIRKRYHGDGNETEGKKGSGLH